MQDIVGNANRAMVNTNKAASQTAQQSQAGGAGNAAANGAANGVATAALQARVQNCEQRINRLEAMVAHQNTVIASLQSQSQHGRKSGLGGYAGAGGPFS